MSEQTTTKYEYTICDSRRGIVEHVVSDEMVTTATLSSTTTKWSYTRLDSGRRSSRVLTSDEVDAIIKPMQEVKLGKFKVSRRTLVVTVEDGDGRNYSMLTFKPW